jgi:ribosomal protein L31
MSNDSKVRVTDNTNLLPGGFIANGVGRGAICITCHNSRNGEPVSGAGNPTLHEDGDANFGTFGAGALTGAGAYKAPHEAGQSDVLMGRNAYFFGTGQVGQRAAHSFLANTCATCHMELTTPPPAFSGGGLYGTNHSFIASLDICTNCHGTYTGGTIQEATDASLATLKAAIESKIMKLSSDSAKIATVTLKPTSRGSPAVDVTYNDGTAALTNATIQTAMGTAATNDILGKAIWNYYLVEQDSSKGIHNPSFIQNVLDISILKVKTL